MSNLDPTTKKRATLIFRNFCPEKMISERNLEFSRVCDRRLVLDG